ncbi:MAG: aminotransferase class V-fold PLP-dependent enzyme [Jiangellaceae bacterium]
MSYFNTAAVGLASHELARTYHHVIDDWATNGLDFVHGEQAANDARTRVAGLIGANPSDVALIPSVSSAAGLVAAQLAPAVAGANVVIGEQEYSSNHFPWRQLERKGYEVRQVPFRGGGLDPESLARRVDAGTKVVAFSGVQSATGHRSDIAAISTFARAVGAIVFVDGSQMVGAVPVAPDLHHIDVLATADHKFLLNAGRGMGYCFLSPTMQERFIPINAGWRAGADPLTSFFGPRMELSSTASRFDSSISWLAAYGNATALRIFDQLGSDAVYARNRHLETHLRDALHDAGWDPSPLPEENRSSIVRVPLGDLEPSDVIAHLAQQRVVAATRDGALRLSVHLYNHEEDIDRLVAALGPMRPSTGISTRQRG